MVVGYYPSWVQQSFPPAAVDFARVTHVAHAFAWPNADGTIASSPEFDPRGFVAAVHGAGKKALLSLGGWGQSDGFSPMAADPARRARFVRAVTDMCQTHGYDGVDLDWEYPTLSDRGNLTALVSELHQALVGMTPSRLLSMAVPAGSWTAGQYDYLALAPHLEWFGCMTYDFHGSWTAHAGHNAPLYPSGGDRCGSVHEAVTFLLSLGLPKEKLLIGVPLYGRLFNATGLYSPSTGGGELWYSGAAALALAGWTYHWDEAARVPYLTNPNGTMLLTFDDTASVALKCAYIESKGLGGAIVWALGQDVIGGQQVLLATLGRRLLTPTAVAQKPGRPAGPFLRCYPDPCNASLTVLYNSPQPGMARLQLYDICGTMVWESEAPAWGAGEQRMPVDVSGLASGTYVCRLQASSTVLTRKVVIVR
ncbi:MAG: glycosyl hydrolase family 18 protein [bacterium]|jgi:chitinase|nr:glycosyl hydrolase family 18 protein [candidate division KSB1 bacterium]MDH7559146.1 glycosyl hydrolase family 18 protein [bacterium]